MPSPRQYFFVQRAFRVLFGGLLDWHVTGVENVPRQGPVLLALNHTSFLDVIVTAMFFPRPIVTFVKAEAFQKPGMGHFLRWMKTFPISRGEVDRAALRRALQVLEAGGVFALAPEGTRTHEGKLIQAKPGVALLAVAARVPVVPMGISGGARGGFATNLKRLRRTRVDVALGEPVRLRKGVVASRESRQGIADELMVHIARLLPEETRGYYANLDMFPNCYFEPLE